MLVKVILLSLMILSIPDEASDDFVPKDISKAVAAGCGVFGVTDSPPYAEAQVFVKFKNDSKGWDYKPVISMRGVDQGGVLKAIDDCRDWLEAVKHKIQATKVDGKESKQLP
jgi:hypothetical protein